MKKYKVYWTEKKSIIIEAQSEDEAIDKVWNGQHDENGVSSEMDNTIEAIEITA